MSHRSIEFLRIVYLRGPNIWTYRPCIEAWVDIGALEDCPSNTLPGFPERLASWLPGLAQHRCGLGRPGGFLSRLKEGTWPAHILEHVTIELMNLAGMKVGFGKARSTPVRGVYKVVVRSRHEEVGRACLYAARDLVMAAIEDRPFDVEGTVQTLEELADRRCLGPSTAAIVEAATERGIPHVRLTEGNLVQLGYGARSRRIWTAESDGTSAIAEGIACDKDLTKRLLSACGVPVPQGRIVQSAEEAWEVAQDIGLPVAVKPVDANHGRGVSLELSTREEVEAAYRLAEQEGTGVIVERFVPGNEHRLLVVGRRVVAAARGESAWVVGDGQATVVELIDRQLNTDPRRGTTEDYPLNKIIVDEDPAVRLELERQGLAPESVPAAGQRVLIQRNGNVAFDVTDRLHPEVAAQAVLAARVVGLDIAGIDLVAEDIGRPLSEQGGAIVEVNAGPGLLMHLKPASGEPRPVGRAIVDHLFPDPGATGRIPIVGITGNRGTTRIARLVAQLLQLAGRRTGLACRDGVFVDGRRVHGPAQADWFAHHHLLVNRLLEAAVFETPARMILEHGLAYDRCNVGIVTDLDGGEDLSDFHVEGHDQLYDVLRTQVDVVLASGVAVLNADDPGVARMAELCDGAVYYGHGGENGTLAGHRERGGQAFIVRDDHIAHARGLDEHPCLYLARVPLASAKPAATGEDLAATMAACLALGLSEELVRNGIETADPALFA